MVSTHASLIKPNLIWQDECALANPLTFRDQPGAFKYDLEKVPHSISYDCHDDCQNAHNRNVETPVTLSGWLTVSTTCSSLRKLYRREHAQLRVSTCLLQLARALVVGVLIVKGSGRETGAARSFKEQRRGRILAATKTGGASWKDAGRGCVARGGRGERGSGSSYSGVCLIAQLISCSVSSCEYSLAQRYLCSVIRFFIS